MSYLTLNVELTCIGSMIDIGPFSLRSRRTYIGMVGIMPALYCKLDVFRLSRVLNAAFRYYCFEREK